ncbi:MAG TPA: hypothetical protein ENI73_07280, partial [Spirochaetes bacterium]|nr:hypothetical protein [Spirochaetota bacterium]
MLLKVNFYEVFHIMRAILFYLSSFLVLTFYGVEVCPYLEKITFEQLAINQFMFFMIAYLIRIGLIKGIVEPSDYTSQPRKQIMIDISLFLFIGFGLTFYNFIVYGYELFSTTGNALLSGLKVILGTVAFGFFASLDLVLERERRILFALAQSNEKHRPISGFFSLPKKFTLVAILGGFFIVVVLLLMIIKDFKWLSNNVGLTGIKEAQSAVIFEILFVIGIVFVLGINLIFSYSKNLKLYFQNETNILEKVAGGDLESFVPVITNDEFGLIASHTNSMIEDLREKRRIQDIFGKVVSPEIAKRIYEQSNDEDRLGGQRQNLVILFSDIRNFTSLTEKNDPEVLVRDLNLYFSDMVRIINDHGGLVDKFIGDGILVIFGLEHPDGVINQAVKASVSMQEAMADLNNRVSIPIEIGIGI